MYFTGDFLHFSLSELQGVCTLVSLFDDDVAKRLDNVYSYHKNILKEPLNQPLVIHVSEVVDYRRKFHTKTVLQPEFIFSDDMDIF